MAQSEKRENSVLFSLRELRQIEENRVQEEEQAVRSAEEQKRAAKEAAERKAREEHEARERAEYEKQLAIEQARENAEREARMRVESAEAAERARQQAALEQQRLQQEMELRRAEVAKKRPTWMLAVTGFCLVGVVVAVVLIMKSQSESDESKAKETAARIEADEAIKAAKEAQDTVDKLEAEAVVMRDKISKAVDAVGNAKEKKDIEIAQANLKALQQEQWEQNKRIAAAKAAAERAKRLKGATVSKECQNNPLAKGCM